MEKKQSFLVEEVLPQVTEMTRPMIEPVSWTTDEDLGQSVEVHCEGAARVPTVKFEEGQLMQWPDIKSDGVMIRGIMLDRRCLRSVVCGTRLSRCLWRLSLKC